MLSAKEAFRHSVENLTEFIDSRIQNCAYEGKTKLALNLGILPEKVYKLLSAKGYKVSYQSKDGKNITVISWGEHNE